VISDLARANIVVFDPAHAWGAGPEPSPRPTLVRLCSRTWPRGDVRA
jgi:hypothetical protein